MSAPEEDYFYATRGPRHPSVEYWMAAERQDASLMRVLQETCSSVVDPHYMSALWYDDIKKYSENMTALHVICGHDSPSEECLQVALSHPRLDINFASEKGWTALHFACGKDHVRIVDCLLSRYHSTIRYTPTLDHKWTPYWLAAMGDFVDCLVLLLYHARGFPERQPDTRAVGYHHGPIRWASIRLCSGRRCLKILDALDGKGFSTLRIETHLRKRRLGALPPKATKRRNVSARPNKENEHRVSEDEA